MSGPVVGSFARFRRDKLFTSEAEAAQAAQARGGRSFIYSVRASGDSARLSTTL